MLRARIAPKNKIKPMEGRLKNNNNNNNKIKKKLLNQNNE